MKFSHWQNCWFGHLAAMRLGNLSCAQTRWPHGQNCLSTVRLKSVCVGIRFLGNRVTDSCAFLCNGGYADKRQMSRGGWERDQGLRVWMQLCLNTHITVSSLRRLHQKKSSLSSLHCSWAHLKCIVKFSRNLDIGFWRDWSLRWKKKKRCFLQNDLFTIVIIIIVLFLQIIHHI